jgi:uncharacterized membrane protein (DUF4010 family)
MLAGGVAMATAVSFTRVFAIAAALQPRLLITIGPALAGAAIAAVAIAVLSVFRQMEPRQHKMEFRNPFDFWSVIGFAISLALIIVLGRAVGETFGPKGAIVGAIVVGLVDVDSVTITLAQMSPTPLAMTSAAYAILAAVASDTASKVAIGALIGRGWFAAQIAVMALVCSVAAAAILGLTLLVMA